MMTERGETREAVKDFDISDEKLCEIMKKFYAAVMKGLSKEGHATSRVKCYQTYVQDFPTGDEEGRFLALDLGGTHFRVLLITLRKGKRHKMVKETYNFPKEIKTGEGAKFFDYIAECIAHFRNKEGINLDVLPMGFTFSFPVRQAGLNRGFLMKWTKGFTASGVEGKDVVELLKAALARRRLDHFVTPVALLNDTTGTLMSCARERPNTRLGLIIGTGSNACYAERIENIELFDGDPTKPCMIINTEFGNFGGDGVISDIMTEYDRIIDGNSSNKGGQTYEKLISGRYLGEIMRLIILKLIRSKILFRGQSSKILETSFAFKSENLTRLQIDSEGEHKKCSEVLKEMGITNYSKQDLIDLVYIARKIVVRSARLVSAVVAVLLNKMNISPVTVGVDGSLYRYHPKYKKILKDKTRQFTNPKIVFEMMLSEDGSGRGAALVAAVLKHNA